MVGKRKSPSGYDADEMCAMPREWLPLIRASAVLKQCERIPAQP